MYARIKDGLITELSIINPFEIYCPELAESFYPCGEELMVGELAILIQGELYRDEESIALRSQRERQRLAITDCVKNVMQESELLGLLGLLGRSGAQVADLTTDCQGKLASYVSALCAALDLDIASGEPSSGDIERIREV